MSFFCCTFAVDFGKVPITFFQLTEIALMVLTVDGIANTHSIRAKQLWKTNLYILTRNRFLQALSHKSYRALPA